MKKYKTEKSYQSRIKGQLSEIMLTCDFKDAILTCLESLSDIRWPQSQLRSDLLTEKRDHDIGFNLGYNSRSSTTPILGWKSLSVSCQRAKGSLCVSCNMRKAMLMVWSGEKPAGWINLERERKKHLNHFIFFT